MLRILIRMSSLMLVLHAFCIRTNGTNTVLLVLHTNGTVFVNHKYCAVFVNHVTPDLLVSGCPRRRQSQGLVESAHQTLHKTMAAKIIYKYSILALILCT